MCFEVVVCTFPLEISCAAAACDALLPPSGHCCLHCIMDLAELGIKFCTFFDFSLKSTENRTP